MILNSIAKKLFSFFVIQRSCYAKQMRDGTYKTLYSPMLAVKLERMLEDKQSFMTYQEFNGRIKWICFDFDIKKEFFTDSNTDENDWNILLNVVQQFHAILSESKITPLIEFSGRRGIHIWLVFDNLIPKKHGYQIATRLSSKLGKLPQSIALDLYPKTANISEKGKGLGLGVKIPLSFHKKSNSYSLFLDAIPTNIPLVSLLKNCLSHSDIEYQQQLLEKYVLIDDKMVLNSLEIDTTEPLDEYASSFMRVKNIETNYTLLFDNILNDLKKCKCLEYAFMDFPYALGHQTREILVGLLVRLSRENSTSYGGELLHHFFSQLPNYDFLKTQEKIAKFRNYYPVSCSFLRELYPYANCENCNLNSPIELLSGVILHPPFSHISQEEIWKVAEGEAKYTYYNDEVPMQITRTELSNIKDWTDKVRTNYNDIITGKFPASTFVFDFIRNEGNNKKRKLKALTAIDKVLTTLCVFKLHNLWYDAIYDNSFGYRLNENPSSGHIFQNWLTLWKEYISNIHSKIYDQESTFESYSLIKLDISGFYDNIDIGRLETKLLSHPITAVRSKLNILAEVEQEQYRNICKYLCLMCRQSSSTGVPQGPAFARYLAEIYLIDLDKTIITCLDGSDEFFYRYVDDIFIFVKDKDKAASVYGKIENWLKNHSLCINRQKSFTTTVKKFIEDNLFSTYLDENKYFIDLTVKRSSVIPEKEKRKAIIEAKKLLHDSTFGLKDNFRFIFSHELDGADIAQEKENAVARILESQNGRGDMYRLFFDEYYLKNGFRMISLEKIGAMNNLALENYFNSLLGIATGPRIHEYIQELLQKYSPKTDMMKMCLLHLALKHDCEPSASIIALSFEKIELLLLSGERKKLSDNSFRILMISENFLNKPITAEQIANYESFMHRNILSTNCLRIAGKQFILSSFEARRELKTLLRQKNTFESFYNLLSLFSITVDWAQQNTDWNHLRENISTLWIEIIEVANFYNHECHRRDWFCFLEDYDLAHISPTTWVECILLNKAGTDLGTRPDNQKHFEQFKQIIAVLVCKNENFLTSLKTNRLLSQEQESELQKQSQFWVWVFSASARLYPEDEVCLKNLALNNMLVLQRGNEFLIKEMQHPKKCDVSYLPDYQLFSDGYATFSKPTNANEFSQFLNSQSSGIDLLRSIYKIYTDSKEYCTENSCGYPNWFLPDLYYIEGHNHKLQPLVPHYALYGILVTKSSQEKNNEEGFCKLLLELLLSKNIRMPWQPISADASNYSYALSAGTVNCFFPQVPELNTYSAKINFIGNLLSRLPHSSNNYISFHSYEKAWVETIWNIIDVGDGNCYVYKFLLIYFKYLETRNKSFQNKLALLFSNISIDFTFDKSNLQIFCDNLKHVTVSEIIANAINLEFQKLIDYFNEELLTDNISLNDFEELLDTSEYEEYSIKEDSSKNPVIILDWNNGEKRKWPLDEKTSDFLLDDRLRYVCKKGENTTILLLPQEFHKIFIVVSKKIKFLESENCYLENDFELFWPHEDQIRAISSDITSIVPILKEHYRTNDSDASIKTRIISWLLQLNPYSLKNTQTMRYLHQQHLEFSDLYRAILTIVKLHNHISQNEISSYNRDLCHELDSGNNFFFHYKHLSDCNGLHALLHEISLIRRLGLANNDIDQLIETTATELIILLDVGLSGSQLIKSIKYYTTGETREDCFLATDSVKREATRRRLVKFSKIKIFSVLVTEQFTSKIKTFFDELFHGESTVPQVEIIGVKNIDKFTYGSKCMTLDANLRNLFEVFICDAELFYKLFNISHNDTCKKPRNIPCRDHCDTNLCIECDDLFYWDSINRLAETNIILRIRSTPKYRFWIFTAHPKKQNILPLFSRREEI